MENEVVEAEQNEEGIIIEMDGNLHARKDLVKSDPNPQNMNGKLFMQFLHLGEFPIGSYLKVKRGW